MHPTGSNNRDSLVREASPGQSSELLIAQAYAALSSAAKGERGERITSLARIGHYEIRMVDFAGDAVPGGRGPFWLELFDHAIDSAVDSCRCNTLQEAVALFDDLIDQAGVSVR